MPLYEEAVSFVTREKSEIELATKTIRESLKKARRNYELQYDNPIDSSTGKKKMFYPLIRQEVNLLAPRFDLDPDALSVRTNEPGLERKAIIWEELLKAQFKKMNWRERMKPAIIPWVNEGTMVVELYWDEEKDEPDFAVHDMKDVYFFPKEREFSSASMFAVKRRVLIADFLENEKYHNREQVRGSTLVRDDFKSPSTMTYEVGRSQYDTVLDYTELYERHGQFPKNLLTGKEKDATKLIDGTITIAWIDKTPVCVEISDKNKKSHFLDTAYLKRSYLLYGMGVGLSLADYQWYVNKIINRRDDNEDILHRGMFLKRRGINVDATQRITGSGAIIELDSIGEESFRQLHTNDITQNSYVGEQNLLKNVRLLNGTEDIVRGTGSSNTASEAAIKDRNAGTRLADPQINLNFMFKRAAKVLMELDRENLKRNAVIKLTGHDDELAVFDDFKLQEVNNVRMEEGLPPVAQEEFSQAMASFNGERFIKIPNMKFLSGDFEPEVDIDASLIRSKAGQSQFILEAMQIAAQVPGVGDTVDFGDLFDKMMSINGLKVKRRKPGEMMMGLPDGIKGASPEAGAPEQQAIKNILQSAGAAKPATVTA